MRQHLLAALVLTLLAGNAPNALPAESPPAPVPNCRFGITVTGGAARFSLADLGVGGYLDWQQNAPSVALPGVDFVHVVRLRSGGGRQFVYDAPDGSSARAFERALDAAVSSSVGQAWLVGNEPDTAFENQDSVTPDQYALAYHNIYYLIKSADPTARVGIGTIVQPTPLRQKWLEAMMAAYRARYRAGPPSDFWSIHSFILREKAGDWGTGIPPGLDAEAGELYRLDQTDSLEIFGRRLFDFRRWMADHGQRNKPLWITEYGSLLPHDSRTGLVTQPPERARDYMLGTFKFLASAADPATGYPLDGNYLVQRWFWYSLDDNLWRFGGSLYDPENGQRTVIGDAFAGYVRATDPRPVLNLARPAGGSLGTWPQHSGGPVLLRATVSNTGSAAAAGPLTLTWYAGDPDSGGRVLATATAEGLLAGCGTSITLSGRTALPPGLDGVLYARLESPGITQPLTLPLTQLEIRHPPP